MTHTRLNGDLPKIDANEPAQRQLETPAENARPPDHEATLRAALATTHAQYRRAMQDAQREPDTTRRRAALVEARRLAAIAGRLQARLRDHLATSYPLRSK